VSKILDITDARIVGLKDEEKVRECMAAIKQVCKRYNCEIVPVITLFGSAGVQAGIQIVVNRNKQIGGD